MREEQAHQQAMTLTKLFAGRKRVRAISDTLEDILRTTYVQETSK